ncbi:TetR/AcrR family transcriptional regulator [Plasticicumulans acidivorans]|uniref:TetR family transcriptional regulator n=1 Tax=Plasticicumulans acidivorans TaxID=886464 RepID=A0A317MZI7_9GAMM|nr:TetR/AcrR family transcriptional regulator [Plasticicumulans acidivorans]PWV65586.1 TetR family transcriptional regulator [Plasticicumulans acidivorans]
MSDASGQPAPSEHDAELRRRILRAATELFYGEGARAVGVEAVVRRAGVNKMSLYRQFASKDALLLHYLEHWERRFWGFIEAAVAQHPQDARARLRQIFIDITERARRPGYRGCPFVNIAAEFADPAHPTRQFVARHKAALRERLQTMASEAGARDPAALAAALALLMEGAYTASQTYGHESALLDALPPLAGQLIDTACNTEAPAP